MKVDRNLKVWSILSPKIIISSKSELKRSMVQTPTAPPVYTNFPSKFRNEKYWGTDEHQLMDKKIDALFFLIFSTFKTNFSFLEAYLELVASLLCLFNYLSIFT
jgi:hypothetical protein